MAELSIRFGFYYGDYFVSLVILFKWRILARAGVIGDTLQRERQSISVTQSRVIPFALWMDSHYPNGLLASYQLTTF